MRNFHLNTASRTALPAKAYAADETGVTIDRRGFGTVGFTLAMGVGGISFTNTNRIDFILQHSENGTDWTPVPGEQIGGVDADADDGIVRSQRTAHAAPTVQAFDYLGSARYVRLSADFNGTHAEPTPFAALALLSRAVSVPVAA